MELPDLDLTPITSVPSLAPPPMPQPRTMPSAASTSSMAAVSLDFDRFDDEDELEIEPLQLETVEEQTERRSPASGPRPLTVPASSTGLPPSRSTSGLEAVEEPPIELDPFEVLAFADYGPIPQKPWEAPSYAIRVVLRRRQLKAEARRIEKERELREAAFFDTLVSLVESLRPSLEAHPDGGRWLAPIFEIEAQARARGEALESTSSEFSTKAGEIDKEIAVIEEACEIEAQKLEPLTEELDRRKAELSRAEAMLKRIDIEIRAAKQAARAAAGPEATVAPPEHAEKIASLSHERELRAKDVAQAKSEVDEVRRPHQAQERVIADRRKQIADLRKARKSLEESYRRQLSVRSEGVAEAERERREMSIEIGKRLLEESPLPLHDASRKATEAAREALFSVRKELAKYERAILAFEREHLKRGLTLIGVAAALFLALVLFMLLRGGEPS